MLPYQPETVEQAKARFAEALADIVDVDYCRFGGETPGMKRRHVFDFADGLRLIVSRDRLDDGEVVIHFSASCNPDSALFRRLRKPNQKRHFSRLATDRFAAISGFGTEKPALVTFVGQSEGKGIPHWHVKEITEEEALRRVRSGEFRTGDENV